MRKVMADIKKNRFRRDILKDHNITKEYYLLAKKFLRDQRIKQMKRKIGFMEKLDSKGYADGTKKAVFNDKYRIDKGIG